MSFVLIAASLAAEPLDDTFTAPEAAAAALAPHVQTGTLLFSQGDCLAVKVYTKSAWTHVAAVAVRDGQVHVYDSQNGAGVRRLTLEEYLAAVSPSPLVVYHPKLPFSQRREELFVAHLERELGRPYAIKHHVTGNRAAGLHCSEYVTDALMACRIVKAQRPPRVSPASLRQGIVRGDLYVEAGTVELRAPAAEISSGRNWCEQLWIDTRTCTWNACLRMKRWVLCK